MVRQAVLSVVCIAALVTPFFLYRASEGIERVEAYLIRKDPVVMAKEITTWKSVKGMKTIETTKMDNETNEQHSARHNEAVDAAQILNPVVQ
jgi:hypothetical protein